MSFTNISTKISNIERAEGSNLKKDLLKNYLRTDEKFAECVKMMVAEDLQFGVKELPEPEPEPDNLYGAYPTVIRFLNDLAKKKGVSNADKQKLSNMAAESATRDIVQRIITKDPGAGFGLKTVNEIAPWLVFKTPYQRCSGIGKVENVNYPALCQLKADSMFSYGSVENSELFTEPFLTRRGKFFNLLGYIQPELRLLTHKLQGIIEAPVFVGELVATDEDGNMLPRKQSNGILNKFIKGKGTQQEASRIIYLLWDVLSGEDFKKKSSSMEYGVRWNCLMNIFEVWHSSRVNIIESKTVKNFKEAQAMYASIRERQLEGAILKDLKALWKDNTCTSFIKMKHFVQGEFEVTGVKEGKGRLKGKVGSIGYKSKDGGIVGHVSSGLDDSDRDIAYWESHIGDIITVQFESVIQDKRNKDVKSLFIPTFVENRFNEKTEADTTEYILSL